MRDVRVESGRQARLDRLALVITDVSSPGLVVVATLVAVAGHSATSAAEAARVIIVSVFFAACIPYAFLAWRVRRAPTLDRHVRGRSDRIVTLLVGLGSTAIGVGCLVVLDAPRDVVALVVAMVAGLVAVSVLTRRWMVSMHLAVAAGALTVVLLVFGAPGLTLLPVLAVVGWARMWLKHHSIQELLVGALLGAAVAATVFPGLR